MKPHSKMSVIFLGYLSLLGSQEPVWKNKAIFPFAQYTAKYWLNHAKLAQKKRKYRGES